MQKLSSKYDEYMRTWTEDRGRPHFIMDKKRQMFKSNDTTSLNLTTDYWTWHNQHGGCAQRNPENFGLKRRMRNNLHADVECSSRDDGRHHDACCRVVHQTEAFFLMYLCGLTFCVIEDALAFFGDVVRLQFFSFFGAQDPLLR